MLFNSISFLIFFPTVFILYWSLPQHARRWLLLGASCYFYMAFVPQYILILFFLITVDYFLGRAIERSETHKRAYFILSIFSNVGVLFVFKYFNFFNENIAALAHFLHWNYSLETLSLILPIGLSFHIFQSLAYIIEVYKGRYPAEKNYLVYALYVMFFPQLVAGPIERPAHLLPQLHAPHTFDYARAISGLRLMLWGLFKKIAIANPLAVLVDHVYGSATTDASIVFVAVVAFSIQLYADFSGYSDIAVGTARMLGIDLQQNFNQPYFSRSTAELWRRWHISLSTWFRDYVYYPLLWKKKDWGTRWVYVCIIITFMLTGLWHGAGWSFVIMGLLFGSYIVLGLVTKKAREAFVQWSGLCAWPKTHHILQSLTVFGLASIANIFFRLQDTSRALEVLRTLVFGWGHGAFSFLFCNDYCASYIIGIGRKSLLSAGLSFFLLLAVDYVVYNKLTPPSIFSRRSVRWICYYIFIIWFLIAGYFAPETFIYFQF
ncbi:MAG: MBOAT family O-acyltransferase [bacterium]|nr:MBOAT family O-acyltransferase [bacterium]